MSSCSLAGLLFILLFVGAASFDGREQVKTICNGKEFHLPVYTRYSSVIFTPDDGGPKRILLEETNVLDSRFKWTRNMVLVVEKVTHGDQGRYAIGHIPGFTFETVHLTVKDCSKNYYRNYGDKFEVRIDKGGVFLEFFPRGAPPESMPVVLWNQTNPQTSSVGRGRLLQGRNVWVAERVTQVDQGNFTVRDKNGNVLSRSILTVHGRISNITHFTKESLNLPLVLPVSYVHLTFTPTQRPNHSSLGFVDLHPPSDPIQLIREGKIIDHDVRYRGHVFLGMNGTTHVVIIERLTSVHDGVYEIRDGDGNLVSSTSVHVIEKIGKWRALLKSVSVPSGMFVSLAGFVLFLKRYPHCSLSHIITCFRGNRGQPAAHPPRVNIQTNRPRAGNSPCHNTTTANRPIEEERRVSFSLPWSSDCLQSSEDCVQFQIKNEKKENTNTSRGDFSTLPLDKNIAESGSVYTSEKLNF
ncbi:uncharacterized protein LOC103390976 isoform X2 [Cynoglossus semilaevis]|uniref:uncharacterized protein LOC103390976 isoform X2 n=1 Tax=Cynoglossus semilaevis TaxID=244447 RepID=UPI0007DCB43A|nr:uncharacterized protein LOC103390976 isoform X2 [Cynoglossus semilaevis]